MNTVHNQGMNEGMCAWQLFSLRTGVMSVCVHIFMFVHTYTTVQMLPLLALHTCVWAKVGICHMVREWALLFKGMLVHMHVLARAKELKKGPPRPSGD